MVLRQTIREIDPCSGAAAAGRFGPPGIAGWIVPIRCIGDKRIAGPCALSQRRGL